MEKYEKVQKGQEKLADNEIRVNDKTPIKNYLKYILTMFKEEKFQQVTLKAMGKAQDKLPIIAEIVKHRVHGLHQINQITTEILEDIYEPLEEGLDTLVFKREVPQFVLILTKELPEQINENATHQEPLDPSEVDDKKAIPSKKRKNPRDRYKRRRMKRHQRYRPFRYLQFGRQRKKNDKQRRKQRFYVGPKEKLTQKEHKMRIRYKTYEPYDSLGLLKQNENEQLKQILKQYEKPNRNEEEQNPEMRRRRSRSRSLGRPRSRS